MRRKSGWNRCEEAGQLISLRLDGELSELEAAALDRHLELCDACRTLADELGGIVAMLREAPLVEFDREFVPGARKPARGYAVGRALGAAALAGAAAIAAVLAFGSSGERSLAGDKPVFRSAQEQIDFVKTEQQRIEPVNLVSFDPVRPQVIARSL
jgi:anti-sigma factor RsiW